MHTYWLSPGPTDLSGSRPSPTRCALARRRVLLRQDPPVVFPGLDIDKLSSATKPKVHVEKRLAFQKNVHASAAMEEEKPSFFENNAGQTNVLFIQHYKCKILFGSVLMHQSAQASALEGTTAPTTSSKPASKRNASHNFR